jgi:hypothetical protein
LADVEGPAFASIINLASDFATLLRILVEQPEIRELASAMKASAGITAEVANRTLELASLPLEDEYEHPADAAMAAYLWLLSNRDQVYTELAAEAVSVCAQCWWAKKMAEHVRQAAARFDSRSAETERVLLESGEPTVDYSSHQDLPLIRRAAHGAGGGVLIYGGSGADFFTNRGTRGLPRKVLHGT